MSLEESISTFLGDTQLVCVVPVPSTELGHEPVAVVSSLDGRPKVEVSAHIEGTFGQAYVLGNVLELNEVGLADWPINASGKMMRTEVQQAVLNHLKARD